MKRLLAVLAVLLLSLRPACDVWAVAHGHGGPGPVVHAEHSMGIPGELPDPELSCCTSVQDGNLIYAGSWGVASPLPEVMPRLTAVWSAEIRFEMRPCVLHPPDAPLTRASYYARSARILR